LPYHTGIERLLLMPDKDNWAANLARQVNERHQDETTKRKVFLAELELKKAQAPSLWQDLKGEVTASVDALNTALGVGKSIQFKLDGMNKVELLINNSMSPVYFDFNPETLELRIGQVNTGCNFKIAVVNGRPEWFSDQYGAKSSAGIAEMILTDTARFI
jgi:hypothetical protein